MYIGQTCQTNPKNRFGKNGTNYKKCPRFWNAIKKYGWDNFEHIIIMDNLTLEMSNIIEKELIKKYDTCNDEFGYNISFGGNNEFIYDTCDVFLYELEGNLVKKYNSINEASTDLKISTSFVSSLCRAKEKIFRGKYVLSYKELSIKEIKDKAKIKMKVEQYDLDLVFVNAFPTIRQASISTNISYGNIQTSCQNKGKYVVDEKYRFIYAGDSFDADLRKRNKRKIKQFDFNGNLLKIWDSLCEIQSFTEVKNISHVYSCCEHNIKTAYGYIWRYEDECDNGLDIENLDAYLQIGKQMRARPVSQYTLDNEFIYSWKSSGEAAKSIGKKRGDTIRKCCEGRIKQCYGFIWKYDNYIDEPKVSLNSNTKHVLQMDNQHNIIAEFESISQAERITGIKCISSCCMKKRKTAGGYIWRYKENFEDLPVCN